jgi:NADP-dependent 3-hydroxy acid dehydrogenase YdfG
MAKTIVVCGYGPAISSAVAEKFGAEGFRVALVARNAEKLAAGAKALEAKGIEAAAFPADVGDPEAVRGLLGKVRSSLGPVTVLHWNANAATGGDLMTADVATVRGLFDVAVTSLLAAVQEALPDLKRQGNDAAILVTNGGFGYFDTNLEAIAVQRNAMGLSVANAAKHKLVGLLAQKLKPEGVYVGEVMVVGIVKGSASDKGGGTLAPTKVAEKFWELYRDRTAVSADVS